MTPGRLLRAARLVAAVLALAVVLVLGPPAVAGWVPLPVDDPASGVPTGSLVVSRPTTDARVEAGDVVTVVTSSNRLVTRTVRAVDGDALTLSGEGDRTSQAPAANLRAVEMYRIPVLGHIGSAIPAPHRPWWGRLAGTAFLTWAVVEAWAAWSGWSRRRSRQGETEVELTSVAVATPGPLSPPDLGATDASAAARPRRELRSTAAGSGVSRGRRRAVGRAYGDGAGAPTSTGSDVATPADLALQAWEADRSPADTTASAHGPVQAAPPVDQSAPLPRRRDLARARRESTWDRVAGLAATAMGAVVMTARSIVPGQDENRARSGRGGRHRGAVPAETSPHTVTAPGLEVDAPTDVTSVTLPEKHGDPARTGATRTTDTRQEALDALWRRRASMEEVARAAEVQDFESRRAAAQAALRIDTDESLLSPAERLAAQRGAARRDRSTSSDPDVVRD